MEEEERLIRESRRCGDIEMMKKSAVAHESRKMESTSKFMNVCSANMVTQVRTKQAQVRIARTTIAKS